MYCSNCGNKLGKNANYCQKCGVEIKNNHNKKHLVVALLKDIVLIAIYVLCSKINNLFDISVAYYFMIFSILFFILSFVIDYFFTDIILKKSNSINLYSFLFMLLLFILFFIYMVTYAYRTEEMMSIAAGLLILMYGFIICISALVGNFICDTIFIYLYTNKKRKELLNQKNNNNII